jgi:hypothetical protein
MPGRRNCFDVVFSTQFAQDIGLLGSSELAAPET